MTDMKRLLRRLAAAFFVLTLCLTSASALSVEEAVDLLEKNYVDKLPAAVYEATTLDEVFQALGDPYTFYMNGEQYEQFTAKVESEKPVSGIIGVSIEYAADGLLITSVLPDSGAKEAGLVPEDVIIAIDGVSCVPGGEQHPAMVSGEPGTFVDLTVRHKDGTTQDYHVERRTITLPNTTFTVSDGVGIIDCSSFGSQTAQYFYEGLIENADKARMWVVDLRSNTGGYADAAVGALGAFTGYGPKLYYRLSDGTTYQSVYLSYSLTNKPVIALVNGQTASASEILSAGVGAEDVGIVIGSRTYGKGTAQITLDSSTNPELFDKDSLKVTVYRFYTYAGNTTDRIGVLPTLLVSDEYAAGVTELLMAEEDKSVDQLRLILNDCVFYVNYSDAVSEDCLPAFAELLAALPPDTELLFTHADGSKEVCLPSELLARCGAEAASRRFSDLSASSCAGEIDTLGVYGLLQGVGDGRFSPDAALTRAELSAMLAHVLNVAAGGTGGFSDVSEDAWYAQSVAAMSRLGFVDGVGDGRFAPEDSMTQEQFIAIMGRLARFLNFSVDDRALALSEEELAADEELASLAPWAREGAYLLTHYDEESVMLHAPLREIDPHSAVTREQAALSLYRMLKTLGILAY